MKKVPMRMCVVCRNMMPKKDLIRVNVNSSGEIDLDQSGKAGGRGAYVCNSSCIDQLLKRKSFDRALGAPASEDLISKIKELKKSE